MFPHYQAQRTQARFGALIFSLCIVAACLLVTRSGSDILQHENFPAKELEPSGFSKFDSVPSPRRTLGGQESNTDGVMCEWVPVSANAEVAASLLPQRQAEAGTAASTTDSSPLHPGTSVDLDRVPIRVIRDTYPTYSAAVVDPIHNEIVAQDENLFQIMVFDRTANTPRKANFTEPKRVIAGPRTTLEFECGIYIDPKTGDIFSLANDVGDRLAVFERKAKGNVPPNRILNTPHGIYGIAVDEEKQEMFLSVQGGSVVVYSKTAKGDDKPIRTLQGPATHLGSPYGIAVDTKRELIFVANHGNFATRRAGPAGTRFEESLITVYPESASGDTAPTRVIQGPKTQLNWPALIYADSERGEIYVANDGDDSILVFRATDEGDVAPVRLLKGPKTSLKNPSSVYVDAKNGELVVSNLGNHSITVFSRDASGDTAPRRIIRSAPEGMLSLTIVNPGGVAYDSKRDELLTPN